MSFIRLGFFLLDLGIYLELDSICLVYYFLAVDLEGVFLLTDGDLVGVLDMITYKFVSTIIINFTHLLLYSKY